MVEEFGVENIVEFDGVEKTEDKTNILEDGGADKTVQDELEKPEDDVQEYDFCVGDIVWVKTKTNTWWPGKIHDPQDSPKSGDQQDCLPVTYFGMPHVAWCHRRQLKPFARYFDYISAQSKARIFGGAVEKALQEFGGRVKLSMNCPCVPVLDSAAKEGVPVVPGHVGDPGLGEFSVTCFDSVKFLAYVKDLALVVSRVGVLDLTVTQSQLSAFYIATGHSQLPMHLLQEGNDAEDVLDQEKSDEKEGLANVVDEGSVEKASVSRSRSRKRKVKRGSEVEEASLMIGNVDGRNEGMIEVGAESRERKRSRYLSYPYVNLGQKGLSVEGFAATIDGGLAFKSTGEKFWKKWYRRFTDVSNISGDSNLKNATSAELLSEFCSAAIDYQYPVENKAFGSVGLFISNFRISVFHDEPFCETYSKNMAGLDEDKDAEPFLLKNGGQHEAKSEPKKRGGKAILKHSEGEDAANMSSLAQSPASAIQGMNGSLGKKRGRPRLGTSKTKSLSRMSDVNTSIAPYGQIIQGSLAVGPLMSCDKPKRKKREKAGGVSQAVGIPDLNGNSVLPTVLVNDQQTIGHAASGGGNVQLENKLGTETASELSKSYTGSGLVDANGNNLKPGTLVVDLGIPAQALPCLDSNQVTTLLSAESKSAPKRRRRKEKVHPEVPFQADGIPDLNGNSAESLSPPCKPERKKRKKKGEALATALLLTFVQGIPLPSKDDLISTFCKFGPLKESETQLLKESNSAQVVFMESADAGEAFQSLEKNNPFGTNLIAYRRFNLPSMSKILAPVPTRRLVTPIESSAQGPCPDTIRQNLQIMTSMLESSGDTLSPEMRAKLESEIKGLLQKLSSTAGSSSA